MYRSTVVKFHFVAVSEVHEQMCTGVKVSICTMYRLIANHSPISVTINDCLQCLVNMASNN